jgi:hypothetical protein
MRLRDVNLGVRFLLELCALWALGYWGWRAADMLLLKIVLAVGAPLAAALVWGMFVAPKATRRLRDPLRLGAEVLVFGSAVAALIGAGRRLLGVVFALVVAANVALMVVWGQRGAA